MTGEQSKPTIPPLKKDIQLERARMTDVMFLLETLFVREEKMVVQILDCLYDIGSVNLINQRVQKRALNRIAKWIARFSKPVFRAIALRWFKRNCPRLITNWLYTQIKFEPRKIAQVVEVAEAETDESTKAAKVAEIIESTAIRPAASDLDLYRQEVYSLHSRVKLLTTLLIGITVTLGSGLAWSLWRIQTQTSHLTPSESVELTEQFESCHHTLQPCQ